MKLNKKFKVLSIGAILVLSLASMVGCSSKEEASKEESKQEQTTQEESKEVAEVKEIKGDEALKIMEKDKEALFIDVRSPEEYSAGHIPNAVNMFIDEFESNLDKLKGHEEKAIVLYCNSGKKSGDAAKILVENGFKDVSNAEGVKKYEYDLVKYKDITAEDMLALLEENKDAVLVDVRPEKDFKKGHIENAINVPFDQVESRLAELDKTKDIVLYCNTGNKSSSVAKQLQEKGYEKVYNAIDGVKEYEFKLVTE